MNKHRTMERNIIYVGQNDENNQIKAKFSANYLRNFK